MYSTKHAQKLFGVKSDQTIRNWVKEFQEFFSVNTSPGKGTDIQFSEDDMRVLDLIASMRAEKRSIDDIYLTLKSGERGKLPEYSPEELDVLVGGEYEKYLSTQINELSFKVEQLTQENDELRKALQPIRDKSIQLEAERTNLERQIEDLKTQLDKERERTESQIELERQRGQQQLERLLREIAELRYEIGKLETRRRGTESTD